MHNQILKRKRSRIAAVLVKMIKHICLFCGSTSGHTPNVVEAVKDLRRVLSKQKIHLIYRTSDLGLMEVISQAVNARGSQVLGIIPKAFAKANAKSFC